MKALTVQQPWAWAVIHGGKDVENRTSLWGYRGRLAIHAGMRISERGLQSQLVRAQWDGATRLMRNREAMHPRWLDVPVREALVLGAIIGVVDLVDVHEQHDGCCTSPWAETSYVEHGGRTRRQLVHLALENPRPVTPIPWKGALGLWTLPADLVAMIRQEVDVDA